MNQTLKNYHPTLELTADERAFMGQYEKFFGQRRMRNLHNNGRRIIERNAEGAYVFDINGHKFLDFFTSGGVFIVGHKNPHVERALQEAMRRTDFSGMYSLSEEKMQLAKKLAETTPEGLEIALPASGGGEANDLALKLAMGKTGRRTIVCAQGSYHGSSGLSVELGPEKMRNWYGGPLLDVKRVPLGDIEELRKALDGSVAACLFEPASYISGTRPGKVYWEEVRKLCDANGTVFIIDEVVSGMGRLGSLWASNQEGVQPDILVTAKGLSGGFFPVAAAVCRHSMLDSWEDEAFRSISTYAWSSVGAAAAKAAIEEVERLLPSAMANADKLESVLGELAARYAKTVASVRRVGMLFLIDFVPGTLGGVEFANAMFERGVIIHASGAVPGGPGRLIPPLILDEEHINLFADRAEDALRALNI